MLGRDVVDALPRNAATTSSRSAAPSSTSPTPPRSRRSIAELRPDAVDQLRRLDRRRRRRGRRGRRRCGQRHGRRRCVAAAAAERRGQGRLRLHRLRLRRRQGRALRRVRPAGAALRLRPHQAGRRDVDRGRQPAPLHRPLLLALRDRRRATSSRRCCGSPASSPRCSWSRDQVGSPDLHLAPRLGARAADRGRGVRHPPHGRGRAVLVVRVRPGDLRPGRGRVPGAWPATTEMLGRPAPRPAFSVLGSERERRDRAARLAGGPRRVPAPSASAARPPA